MKGHQPALLVLPCDHVVQHPHQDFTEGAARLTATLLQASAVPQKPLSPTGYFLAAPMRNFLVPQTAHWPVTAGRPFLRTTSWASGVSVFSRHLKQ